MDFNNLDFSPTETTFETTLCDIETKLDKKGNNYYLIRTSKAVLNNQKTFIAFSQDRDLDIKTKSLLENFPHRIIGRPVKLTVKKKPNADGRDGNKVISIELLND